MPCSARAATLGCPGDLEGLTTRLATPSAVSWSLTLCGKTATRATMNNIAVKADRLHDGHAGSPKTIESNGHDGMGAPGR